MMSSTINRKMKYLIIILTFLLVTQEVHGQCNDNIKIYASNGNKLINRVDNCIQIFVTENNSVPNPEQVYAYHYTPHIFLNELEPKQQKIEYKDGWFWVYPDSVGLVEVIVDFEGIEYKQRIGVLPIRAVIRVSMIEANSERKMSAKELKSQRRLVATVECCGLDTKCAISEFELIKIGMDNNVSRVKNVGEEFEERSYNLIRTAEPGDIYIFRNIYYRCPGSGKERAEDMIFELE